jgi:glucose-1-phosphatase
MKLTQYDAVIFDLGGVIINLNYDLTIQAFEELGMRDFSEVYTQLAQSTLFDDYETGRISSQHFINKLLDHVPSGTSPNRIVAAWNAMILDVPVEKPQLLKSLNAEMPIFLLSNTNEIHMQKVNREWGISSNEVLENHFSKVYLSYEVGMRKPDLTIFQKVCAEQGLVPKNTLFIDDSPQHIDGAQLAGLQTLHLKHPEKFYDLFS